MRLWFLYDHDEVRLSRMYVTLMNRRKRTKPTRTAHVPMMRSHDWPFSLNAMDLSLIHI